MASLASFHRVLAPLLGFSEAALYERQKALVRIGALPKATGRGWASGGAAATPDSVAWILVSVLATDNLSEVPEATPALANCRIGTKRRGPFAAETGFKDAVAQALADAGLARKITSIRAVRKLYGGSIGLENGQGVNFIGLADARPPALLTVEASLFGGDDLVALAQTLEAQT
ncbi:hypothetical protein [Bradyrhizobium sp. MOS002]|uniref:hypothetical protein n=1 Tax=Bradyrhizobium sp. MOS002 TaxID=2133947 RepID=UPI000D115522|nr:hypothetical protein [Bradyrhizobium sp. MOS002]PSO29836.1 hypothetical protein C7G41_24135 [Bradyrhizobium sp. MOS002]